MMSKVSMVEANLPPGFRFYPRDEELVCDYLMKKIFHSDSLLFIEVDLNKCEPWDIPETACVGGKDWYFYSLRDRKYATGVRTNRATASGYWKATGKDRAVLRKGVLVGMRKTLVFYKGRAPKGTKSDWVMHEFRLHSPPKFAPHKEDWVLCRAFHKNREVVAKPSMENCYDDTRFSSLPPLMDSYISFDQTQPNLIEDDGYYDYEQVPCFSIFSHNQTNPIFPNMITNQIDHYPNVIPSKNITTSSSFGQLPIPTSTSCPDLDNDFSSDKKAIKPFLNQLTKMDSDPNHIHGSSSLGEAASSESYLSEVGISNLWTNHHYC